MSHLNFIKYGHLIFDRPDLNFCFLLTVFDHSNMICQWSSSNVAEDTGSAQKLEVKTKLGPNRFVNQVLLLWAGLEGGALLLLGRLGGWGTTSSVCSEAVTTAAALWPPNNSPLSSLWAPPAQELFAGTNGFVTKLDWKSQIWWYLWVDLM